MDKQMIHKRLGSIESEIAKISNDIFALKLMDIARYPENYQAVSTDAAMRLERAACRMRNLIFSASITCKNAYMGQAKDAHGIQVEWKNGMLSIRLPGLLPRRKVHAVPA